MDNIDIIQKAIDQGRAIEAQTLGRKFDIYRQNELIYPRFPVKVEKRATSKAELEAALSLRSIVMMELVCDATNLEPGDVFQGPDSTDRYVLASKRNLGPVLGFRTEHLVNLRRPTPQKNNPAATNKDPYGGRKQAQDQVLTYDPVANEYGFSDPAGATEVQVYAGKSQLNYTGSVTPLKLPLDTRVTRWLFVLELLPGLSLQEGDYVVFEEQYFQIYAVDVQVAGFHGQVLTCDLVKP